MNRYGGHVKRVRLRSGWALVQSEEGGTPVMGAVCEMGGERRLGVGVERESMGGRTVCETSFEEMVRLRLALLNERDWGACWAR